MRLIEFAKQEFPSEGQAPDTAEILDPREIDNVISMVRRSTGVDVSDAQVADLPGDTAGVFYLTTKRIEVDEEIVYSDDLGHVLTHEAFHKRHLAERKAKGMDQISDIEVEEALTELATKEKTGKVIAYRGYISSLVSLAGRAGETVSGLIDLYVAGNSDIINEIIEQVA